METYYFNKVKVSQMIIELIYLAEEMRKNGHIDHFTLNDIDKLIEDLRYNVQFLK